MGTRIQILGDVTAVDAVGRPVALGGPRQRCLLAALALRSPEFVSADWLVESVWPDVSKRPDRPADTVRTYIARLRRLLGGTSIETGAGSYRLRVDVAELDCIRFEELLQRSQASDLTEDERQDLLTEALSLWSGEAAFGDFGGRAPFDIERHRLGELRIMARENLLASGLRSGNHRGLVGDLYTLAADHPLREEPVRLLMTALYRTGSQAEALRAFQRYRSLLVEELGLEPSPGVVDLEQRIARGDVALRRGSIEARLDGYELGERLDEDRHGTYYDAIQTGLGRRVEIYAIDRRAADRADFIRSFEAEAQRVAGLHHPSVVPIIDYWRSPGGAFLVTTRMTGGTLADRLNADLQSLDEVLAWLRPVGEALATAHSSTITHGNLGARSVQFDEHGNAYLGRFGLSSLHELDGPLADLRCLAETVEKALANEQPRGVGLQKALDRAKAGIGDVETFVAAVAGPATAGAAAGATDRGRRPPSDQPNVYQGLRAFEEADASRFHGREVEVDQVVRTLTEDRFVALVGPSGCGKSSIVRAGVIPRLRETTDWFIVTMTPGPDPFAQLAAALLRVMVKPAPSLAEELARPEVDLGAVIGRHLAEAESEVVIVIDQFEELYTLTTDRQRRARFLDALVGSTRRSAGPLRVLTTIRADFFDRPLRHPELGRLFTRHQLAVLPMTAENLERAISGPAEAVGVTVEPALLAALIAEIDDREASLPMLQYTLFELFERRTGHVLDLDTFRTIGGLSGAISARAEQVYQGLGADTQHMASRVLPELVALGEGTEDTRRRVDRVDLPTEPTVDELLDELGTARLLTFDHNQLNRRPTVELAHEALIREWPRLRSWVDDNRERIRVARQVDQAAAEWERGGRDPSDLYRGGRLALVLDHHLHEADGWTARAREFIEAARNREVAERSAEARANRRLRAMAVTVGAVAVVAILATVVASLARRDASRQATEATAARLEADNRRLVADAARLADTNRRVALLLAAEAYRRDPSPASLGGLQSVIVGTPGFQGYIDSGHGHSHIDWSDADHVVATGGGRLVLLDVDSARVVGQTSTGDVTALTVNADDRTIAVASGRTVSVVSGDPSEPLEPVAGPFLRPSQVVSLVFDGNRNLIVGHRDGSVAILELSTGEVSRQFMAHPEQSMREFDVDGEIEPGVPHQTDTFRLGVDNVAVSPDGRTIVTGSLAVVRIWTTAGDLVAETYSTRVAEDGTVALAGVRDIHVAADDRILVASSFAVGAHAGRTGEKLWEQQISHPYHLTTALPGVDTTVRLHDDGVVIGGNGGVLAFFAWQSGARDRVEPILLDSQLAGDPAVAVSPDRRRFAFAAEDGIAILNRDGSNFGSVVVEVGDAENVNITDDGTFLVASRADNRPALFFDLGDGVARAVNAPAATTPTFAWAGQGDAVHGWRGPPESRLWAFDRRLRVVVEFDHSGSALDVAVSDEKGLVAVSEAAGFDGRPRILIFDSRTGQLVNALDDLAELSAETAEVRSMGFSHDGRFFVAADDAGASLVWRTSTWEPMEPILSGGGGGVSVAKYAPGDAWLVTVAEDGVLSLRDPTTFQPVHRLSGNTDGVSGLSYGPFFTDDGRYMITTADGFGRIWDLEERVQVGGVFRSDTGLVGSASTNGRHLATLTGGKATVWDLRLDRWFDMVCHAAGRNMTVEEWEQFGPAGEPYQATCAQWPDSSALGPTISDD